MKKGNLYSLPVVRKRTLLAYEANFSITRSRPSRLAS